MKLNRGHVYIPKNAKKGKVKYLTICAFSGDNEIMAIDGIMRGYRAKKYPFACIVTCNDTNYSVNKEFAKLKKDELVKLREEEQKQAAEIGHFNSLYFMDYPSKMVRDSANESIVKEYAKLIKKIKPRIVYTHSLLDSDPTHIGVAIKVIYAIRSLPKGSQPKVIYGCEIGRDLDWVNPEKLVYFNNSKNIRLQKRLINVHTSNGDGVRDYSNAAIGRRYSNATNMPDNIYVNPKLITRAINMTNIARNKSLPIRKFAMSFVDELYGNILEGLERSL